MKEQSLAARFDGAAENLGRIGAALSALSVKIKAETHEIRLRINRPVVLSTAAGNIYVTAGGAPAYSLRDGLLTAGRAELDEAFRLICSSSVYSHQQEIRNGFVTVVGGHRAGICGTAVLQGNEVINIRDISSVNLRIAREIRGAADETGRALFSDGKLRGGFLVGPPGCGKTTVLRDLARQLSGGLIPNCRVAVVDERGEIAASFRGVPQNDLGPCCDVLDGYPKGEGILQALRSLSPDVILCDEIGGEGDAKAVLSCLNAGVPLIASAHAANIGELMRRPAIRTMLTSGAFQKIVLLSDRRTPCRVQAVYGEEDLFGGKNTGTDGDLYCLHGSRAS